MNAPQLSRYEVLGRLATGGMAEVWLARTRGVAGFQKLVVLKTILPSLANIPQFVSMFVAEAQLAAMLTHPNCIQIFDLGQEEGWLYIAMEFLEGFSLARLMNRAKQRGVALDDRVLARILMDAATGLDYAHRFTDRDGTHLKLVHRDVSPDNLLIGFSGQVKVVDFGIAKAATPAVMSIGTVAGTVKGKHGYIAPEYLAGKPIDARADLFALGVVLFRALTGKRPFRGDNEAELSMAVLRDPPLDPFSVKPDVNPGLAAVALKALQKDPAQRFESARAMRQAIEAAVGRAADSEDVAELMTQLWPRDDRERVALDSLASGTSEETSSPLLRGISGTFPRVPVATPARLTPEPLPPPEPPAPVVEEARAPVAPAPPSPAPVAPIPVFIPTPTADFDEEKRSRLPLLLGLTALVAIGAILGVVVMQRVTEPAATPPPSAVARPREPTAPPTPAPPPAPGPAMTTGKVRVATTPTVTVAEGKTELGTSPLELELPPGPHTLRLVNKAAGIDQEHVVTVTAGDSVALEELSTGRLVVKAEPFASVKVDGKKLGETPVTLPKVFEGPHVVELFNTRYNETRRVEVKVRRGETRTVSVDFDAE